MLNDPYADYQTALIEAAQDFHAHEMDVGATQFERWAEKVEAILDLPYPQGLDGDEDEDGYSLDGAYEAFLSGMTVKQYAAGTVLSRGQASL